MARSSHIAPPRPPVKTRLRWNIAEIAASVSVTALTASLILVCAALMR